MPCEIRNLLSTKTNSKDKAKSQGNENEITLCKVPKMLMFLTCFSDKLKLSIILDQYSEGIRSESALC